MVEYIYYWYHHFAMNFEEQERINKIITESKDFDAFIEIYKKYEKIALDEGIYFENSWCPMTFFPTEIIVFANEEIIDRIDILDKENFNKITYSECECG